MFQGKYQLEHIWAGERERRLAKHGRSNSLQCYPSAYRYRHLTAPLDGSPWRGREEKEGRGMLARRGWRKSRLSKRGSKIVNIPAGSADQLVHGAMEPPLHFVNKEHAVGHLDVGDRLTTTPAQQTGAKPQGSSADRSRVSRNSKSLISRPTSLPCADRQERDLLLSRPAV